MGGECKRALQSLPESRRRVVMKNWRKKLFAKIPFDIENSAIHEGGSMVLSGSGKTKSIRPEQTSTLGRDWLDR